MAPQIHAKFIILIIILLLYCYFVKIKLYLILSNYWPFLQVLSTPALN